jgi:hypothetical protein
MRRTRHTRWLACVAIVIAGFTVSTAARGGILSKATAKVTGSVGTAIGTGPLGSAPGPASSGVSVSQAEAGPDGGSWSALKVGDTVILGRRTNSSNGYGSDWMGTLAGLGGVIDAVNSGLCRPLPTGEFAFACISLLGADFSRNTSDGENITFASGHILRVDTSPDGSKLFTLAVVGHGFAYYNEDNLQDGRCTQSEGAPLVFALSANGLLLDPGPTLEPQYLDRSQAEATCSNAPPQ